MVEFLIQSGTISRTNRSTAYLGYGIGRALDLIAAGRPEQAEAALLLLLVALEQASKDNGRWQLAWMLTFALDPPWARMTSSARSDPLRPFGHLAGPGWTTACMAYTRDAATLAEVRRKWSEDTPSHGDKKHDGKGGDKGDKDTDTGGK